MILRTDRDLIEKRRVDALCGQIYLENLLLLLLTPGGGGNS